MAAKKAVKKSAPAKKVAKKAVKKAAPVKKAAKKAVKKAAPAKKAVKKAAKKAAPAKKAVKKAAVAKKAVKKSAPAKKAVKKAAPAKKVAKKAAVAKKVAKQAAKKAVETRSKGSSGTRSTDKTARPTPASRRNTESSQTKAAAVATSAPPVETAPAAPTPIRPGMALGRPMEQPKPAQAPSPAVLEDETPWTSEELEDVRVALGEEYVRLEEELRNAEEGLADLIRDSGDGSGDDQADAGNKTFEREHEMSLANNAREMMRQVQHALGRIEDGSYGTCEGCGRAIGKLRLQAFPRATMCRTCKEAEERL